MRCYFVGPQNLFWETNLIYVFWGDSFKSLHIMQTEPDQWKNLFELVQLSTQITNCDVYFALYPTAAATTAKSIAEGVMA